MLKSTGQYGYDPVTNKGYRGWMKPIAVARRGTGFLSVGELLNVRHPDAYEEPFASPGDNPWDSWGFDDYSFYRMDAGVNGSFYGQDQDDGVPAPDQADSSEDYVSAVSMMVALGDWVTVRSQVFTIYGVIRGDEDSTIADPVERAHDVDSRALRFQETVDRLPTFLGDRMPTHVGERVLTRYQDVLND